MTAMLWIAASIAFFLVLRGVELSDGDDTYFYYCARSMGFFEYLSWRYQTWVGRMAGEALVYLVFRSNIWLWRLLNACMMVLLPAGVLRLGCKAAGYRDYSASSRRSPNYWTKVRFSKRKGRPLSLLSLKNFIRG